MNIINMTKEDFDKIPKKVLTIGEAQKLNFVSMVIIPNEKIHDSNWRCMDIVLVDQHLEPICRVETYSDVLHLDGIGGKGYVWVHPTGQLVESKGWKIDCLPCGYLRVFNDTRNMHFGDLPLSDLEIYSFY